MKFAFSRRSTVLALTVLSGLSLSAGYLKWRVGKIDRALASPGDGVAIKSASGCEDKAESSITLIGDSRISRWCPHPDFGDLIPIRNMGIGGETLNAVYFRLQREAIACRPRAIVLQAGINDLVGASFLQHEQANNVGRTLTARFLSIAAHCSYAGVPLVITTIIPPGRPTALYRIEGVGYLAALVARVNQQLLQTKWPPGVELLDVSSALLDGSLLTIRREFQDDTLHLSLLGYGRLNRVLLDSSIIRSLTLN